MTNGANPYSLLSRLPLFQGMSLSEFDSVIAHVRLGFSKAEEGESIAHAGQKTGGLVFVLRGDILVETAAEDGGYKVVERVPAPCVLQPERLFGMTQRYSRNHYAAEDCSMMTIEKPEVLRIMSRSEVFRFNLLNLLCTQEQRSQNIPWQRMPKGIKEKIAFFIAARCLCTTGSKSLVVGMVRLAEEIGESRLNVSRALHAMQDEGLLKMSRERIDVFALENL